MRIVACGGGLFEDQAAPLREFILSLARQPRPRVCFLPTAAGDNPEAIARFYRILCAMECRPSDLPLFYRDFDDIRAFLMKQDVIWVAGGNTANALAIWRVHGVDTILREAWEAGCVMTGASAGMNCWFEASVTDSFSLNKLAALEDGLGWLAGSACPHYDAEEMRRPVYRSLVEGGFPAGVAAEDGVGLVYSGVELEEAVSWREDGGAWRVGLGADGVVSEERLAVRAL
ncbi:MAG: dipeptidase [Thermoleophilaceae bacterium]|nr:dipeptidase [Thermoleophilaceae bacterium]